MNPQSFPSSRGGFTLIEVLVALGLCALLAMATAAAVTFAARAEKAAVRCGEGSLLVPSLYAAQRLRPDGEPVLPPAWRAERAGEVVKFSEDLLQEWHTLAVEPAGREIPAFTLWILDAAP